jgi:hypothetical protein
LFFSPFPPAAVNPALRLPVTLLAARPKSSLSGNGGGFLPEYMRFVAWKSSRALIRGIRLSQRRKAIAKANPIDYILA